MIDPLPAALAGFGLLLAPGLTLLALLPERDRRELPFDEALFLALASSVAAAAWLGLLLAELGRFSLLTAGGVLGVGSLLALVAGWRRAGWPLPRPRGIRALVPVAAVLAVALALQARPSEYIVGGRDPGAYVAAMALIGRTGGIVYTDPVVLSIPPEDRDLFFRYPDGTPFTWARFMGFDLESPQTGRVFPQFFHLFPAFGAYLFQAMGIKGALATPALFGILGTLAVFLALRRSFGPAVAFAAALLLALNPLQVWFARYPVSEPMSQFLIFLGLVATAHWEERGSAALGALAGFAFGLSLLVRIDSVLLLAPLGFYFLLRRAGRDLPAARAAAILVPLGLLAAHAALHAAVFSHKYVQNIATRPYWRLSEAAWLSLALAAGLLLLVLRKHGRRVADGVAAHAPQTRKALAGALLLLALYAYFVRPQLSAWAGADGNPGGEARTSFVGLDADGDGRLNASEFSRRPREGTPEAFRRLDDDGDLLLSRDEWRGDPPWPLGALSFQRLAAHDAEAFRRFGWFVTPLGLAAALLGFVRALLDWKPAYRLPLAIALGFALFYFYKMRVWNDYYFAMRRVLPVILPLALALAALFLAWLARRGGFWRLAAAGLLLALAVSFGRDTARIARHVDWRGSVNFVRDVARRFGPRDVVIFEQPRSVHLLSLPLWAAHGANVLELARFNPDPERLRHLLSAWRGRYANVYFVHTYRTDLCGVFLQRLEEHGFAAPEWERSYDRPPQRPETRALHFTVSRVLLPEELQVPALPEVDIGGSDDFQVSGFFDKEGGADRTYRWTGPCASLFLPGARAGAELVIMGSVGVRPTSSPAVVRASFGGVPVGSFTVGADWAEHVLHLPDPLPEPRVLRLDVPGWRPANVFADSNDIRDLGVMLDSVRVRDPREPRASMPAPRAGGGR